MAFTDVERQQKRKNKMRSKNFTLVPVWVPNNKIVEIKAIAARMTGEENKDLEPTSEQIAYAQILYNQKEGLRLSQEVLSSSQKLSEWINESEKAMDKDEIKS